MFVITHCQNQMRNRNRDLQQSKLTGVRQLLSRLREILSHKCRKERSWVINQTCIWSIAVNEHPQYNLMKIRPVGAQLLHMDGQTDRQTDIRHDEGSDCCFSQLFCESF